MNQEKVSDQVMADQVVEAEQTETTTARRGRPKINVEEGEEDVSIEEFSSKVLKWEKAAEDVTKVYKSTIEEVIEEVNMKMASLDVKVKDAAELKKQEKSLDDREELIKKHVAYINSMHKHITEAQAMLDIGRKSLNEDKKRHETIMKNTMEGIKKKAQADRAGFIQEVTRAMETYQVPKYHSIVSELGTENEAIMADIEEINRDLTKYLSQ